MLSVDLPHPVRRTASRRRFVSIRVAARHTADGLDITVVDGPAGMVGAHRRAIERHLVQCIERAPDSRFVGQVRDVASDPWWIDRPGPKEALERIDSAIQTLDEVAANDVQATHDRLIDLVTGLDTDVRARRASQSPIEVLATAEDLRAEALSLIASARRQLVISSPWIRARALNTLIDPLRSAMDRGVRVFILWGISAQDRLDD